MKWLSADRFFKMGHCVLKLVSGRKNLTTSARCCSAHLADIREQLGKYKSGTVELQKNSSTGLAVITLNNPGKKNALSGSMMVELADHVTELGEWKDGKGLILMGASKTFCSGGDLSTVSAILNSRDGERMSRFMHDTLTRLYTLPMVSVALVEGVALGGGAELATACDVRIMTNDAKIGFVQIRMGVTTGWGGATRLYSMLGRTKTLKLLGSGKVLTAHDAASLGLADYVLPDSLHPLEAAQSLLSEQFCKGDARIVRRVKETVVGIEQSDSLQEALDFERKVFASVWGSDIQKTALQQNIKHS